MDAGIFLQTVMLLLLSEGLDSCAQIAWAEYHQTVADVLSLPPDHILASGMAIGYADPDGPMVSMPRANLGDLVTFLSD
jgi:nitroreductase